MEAPPKNYGTNEIPILKRIEKYLENSLNNYIKYYLTLYETFT